MFFGGSLVKKLYSFFIGNQHLFVELAIVLLLSFRFEMVDLWVAIQMTFVGNKPAFVDLVSFVCVLFVDFASVLIFIQTFTVAIFFLVIVVLAVFMGL